MLVDASSLSNAVRYLAEREPVLHALYAENGLPPLWHREGGFATIVALILEQQVSLASARAANRRLVDVLGGEVDAAGLLELSDQDLRAVGFSRQKADYCRDLATEVLAGRFDASHLESLDDGAARSRLQGLRGVGPWTAECYLLFCLRRPDAWPTGDRALYVSMRDVFDLGEVPSPMDGDDRALRWSPWRSVAARMLWHDYLRRRGLDPHGLGTSDGGG